MKSYINFLKGTPDNQDLTKNIDEITDTTPKIITDEMWESIAGSDKDE